MSLSRVLCADTLSVYPANIIQILIVIVLLFISNLNNDNAEVM